MLKIVVLDGHTLNPGDLSWSSLNDLGELTVYDRTEDSDVIKRISDATCIYTNKTPITREVIETCPGLKFIGVLATGYNIVNCEAAKEKGIIVCNVPTYGTEAVGQFAIALLLEICHHIGHHSEAVHEGKWEKINDWCFWDYPLIELANKTIGIIGYGRIGQTTGRIARSLNMNVLAYDHYINEATKHIAEFVDLDTLLEKSDVIVLHCPLTPETEGMINKNNIQKMKHGVILINNSRGQLIVEEDLAAALDNGKIFAAGLDVVSSEPIKSSNPLLKAKNCIITPHISWASKESRQRLMNIAVDNLKAYINGIPSNAVNL